MACFLVPAAEAAVTTVAAKILKSREAEHTPLSVSAGDGCPENGCKIPFSRKLGWLNKLLWGGSALLAFEHVWHGELIPYFPFLSNAANPADAAAMLREMATAGVTMALLVTAVWAGMLAVASGMEKRTSEAPFPVRRRGKV